MAAATGLSSLHSRVLYYYSDYLLSQFVVYARYQLRGYTVLYDRYYFDFIVDARRSNISLSEGFTRSLYRLVRKPDLNILLYAPVDDILRRKQELDADTIQQLTDGYLRLFDRLSGSSTRSVYLPLENTDKERTLRVIESAIVKAAGSMKILLEQIIRLRNPHFRFDESVTSRLLLASAWSYGLSYLRGLRLLLLAKMPRHVLLGRGVGFFNSSNIRLGRWVKLGDHVQLSAAGTGELVIGDHSGIGAFSRVVIATSFNQLGSHIRIGKNVGIGEFAYLGGGGGLEIGDDCIVGQYFSCHPENHITVDPNRPILMQGVTRKGIRVGKDCWIGSKVTILDGVEIGDHCVIAAGAVVTRSMPSGSVIAGVPARVIRSRSADEPVTYQHRAS